MTTKPLAQADRDHLDDCDLVSADDRTCQGPHALHVEAALTT